MLTLRQEVIQALKRLIALGLVEQFERDGQVVYRSTAKADALRLEDDDDRAMLLRPGRQPRIVPHRGR